MSNTPPAPPFLARIWATLIPVLAAFGIPSAAVVYFLTKHPLLALAILFLYELGVFVVGFLGKVWGKLETPLVEHFSSWLKQWVISTLSRYRRQYYSYLHYQHRDFDVKGLSTLGIYALELDHVFIELRIDPSTPQSAVVNPVQVPQASHGESHTIWEYLASTSLLQQQLVVIGPPGSGKTTLLKHIVLSLVASRKPFHWRRHGNRSGKMPILLFLRDHAQAINEQQQYSLVTAIQDHLLKWEQPLPPEGWFQWRLHRGRCLIMLDGLDEVADPETRKKVVSWVERQMRVWSRNRFLVTSRPFGYRSNPLSRVTTLEVRPFTLDQVERFVNRWYLANEIMSKQKDDPGVRMRAKVEAKALLERLRTTPALFELTVNPLLLTMIVTVHRYGGELPGKRVTLYAEICEVFLGKRQQTRGQTLQFTPIQTQSVLEPLAYHMIVKGIRDIGCDEAENVIEEPLTWVSTKVSPKTFLRDVENISGLLLERENNVYSFAHKTFQEYLAAAYIKRKQLVQALVMQMRDAWWRETIRLYCAMEDASPIIVACLEEVPLSAAAIELAIDCDREAQWVQPAVRNRVEMLLNAGMENPDLELQHVFARALLARRLRHMIHLKDEIYVDTMFITCAEYQVFLDEEQARGHYFQPDHWTSHRFASGWGNKPVLGIRASAAEAFCTWLTESESGAWCYRLPRPGELEKESSLLNGLPTDTGYWLHNDNGFTWIKKPLVLSEALAQEVVKQLYSIGNDDNLDYAHTLASSFVSDLARDLARAHTIASAIKRAHNRAIAIAGALDLIRVRAPDRARTIVSDLTSASELARNLISDLDLDHARALVIDLDRTLAHASNLIDDLLSALASALASDSTSDLARDLARDLAQDLAQDLDPASNLTSILIGDLARAHASASASTSTFDLTLANVRDRDRASTFTPAPDRILDFALARTLTLNLELALSNARAHAPALAHALDFTLDRDLRSARAHDLAFTICSAFIFAYERIARRSQKGIHLPLAFRQGRKSQRVLYDLLDIYFGLAILQKRIRGELSACEGILIVKEKR